MRLVVGIVAVTLGCGGPQPKPNDDGPGTTGVVDDTDTDGVQIAEAAPEALCVDMATLRPDQTELPAEAMSGRGAIDEPTFPGAQLLDAVREGEDATHTIVGAARVSPDAWVFAYTRCTDIPLCAFNVARAERRGDGYTATRREVELVEPVVAPKDVDHIELGIIDHNGDGADELWMALDVRTYEVADGMTTSFYLGAYAAADLQVLLWTRLGFDPYQPAEAACAFELGFHDADCDRHTDVVVSRRCSTYACLYEDDCAASGPPEASRELHLWRADAGIYYVSAQPWTPPDR